MNNPNGKSARTLEVVAAFGLGVEALVLTFAAIAYGIYAALGGPQDVGFIVAVGVFCLLLAIGVGFGARGMWQSRRWARSIALTWQVFQAGIGLAVISERPVVGIVLIAVALIVAACVMARVGRDNTPAEPDTDTEADDAAQE
ncbi:hypothetical protein [Demequina aurantiaca]|uniref:hypothetical protein n=1 Tax=Demequina aurantiaca TaxID=676200 RepID=UPI003D335EAF